MHNKLQLINKGLDSVLSLLNDQYIIAETRDKTKTQTTHKTETTKMSPKTKEPKNSLEAVSRLNITGYNDSLSATYRNWQPCTIQCKFNIILIK